MLSSDQFEQQTDIILLRIPRGTERICGKFGRFFNLTRIVFESSSNPLEFDSNLGQIDENCFSNCHSLEQIHLPRSVHTISRGAFSNCTRLRVVLLEPRSSLTNIGDDAFQNCHQLSKFQSENAQLLSNIGDRAFSDCLSLERFVLFSTIVRIGVLAFSECFKLSTFDILPRPMDYFAAAGNGGTGGNGGTAGNGNGNGNSDQALTIGKNAFRLCRGLTVLDFKHVRMELVDILAFGGCAGLVRVNNIKGVVAESAFYGCVFLGSVDECEQLKSIYPSVFNSMLFPRFSFVSDTVVLVIDKALISRDTVVDCDTITMPEWLVELNTDEFEPSVRENMTLVVDVPTLVLTARPGSKFTLRRCVVRITTREDARVNYIICGKYKHPNRILPFRFGIRIVGDQIVYPDNCS